MELNKKVLDQLAGMLKVDAEVLATGLTSEVESIETPKGTFFTDSELATLKDNHGKERYDAGATASREILLKELADEHGLDRTKDPKEFVTKFKSKILEEAKIEPQKKVTELEQSLENLRAQLTEKDNKFKELESNISKKELKFKAESLIPNLPEGLGLSKQEATDLFFMQHEIKEDGIYRNGQKLKDNMEGALDFETSVKSFVAEKGWDKAPAPTGRGGGAGQGQSSPALPTTFEEYESYIKEKGLHAGSAEARSIMEKAVAANPESFES